MTKWQTHVIPENSRSILRECLLFDVLIRRDGLHTDGKRFKAKILSFFIIYKTQPKRESDTILKSEHECMHSVFEKGKQRKSEQRAHSECVHKTRWIAMSKNRNRVQYFHVVFLFTVCIQCLCGCAVHVFVSQFFFFFRQLFFRRNVLLFLHFYERESVR